MVTGASRGLGASIAATLAGEGARVELLARDSPALAAVVERLGSCAHPITTDLTDPASIASAFETVAERHGWIDVLVNNAGAGAPRALEELTDGDLDNELAVNFLGPVRCIRAAVGLLSAAGGGDVINVSSVAVLNPYPTMWLYSAAKAALELASAGLVDELRPHGIRVSVLRTGSIAGTGFQDGWSEEGRRRAAELANAAGRERFAGAAPVDPDVLARWVLEIAALPPGVRAGLVELRPS